jgi:hypothetical protein
VSGPNVAALMLRVPTFSPAARVRLASVVATLLRSSTRMFPFQVTIERLIATRLGVMPASAASSAP